MTGGVSTTIVALTAALLVGCAPVYTWDTNTTSTARPASLDISELSQQPVATVAIVAPGALQGFSILLSHALVATLANASPPIRAVPAHEIANTLNDQGLGAEYADLLSGFARNGIMDRERLRRIGAALGARYVLLPGLAQFDQALLDRFEVAGIKVIRTRVTVLRVWLQLWDTGTGHILWESAGEMAAASNVVKQDRMAPVDAIARRLWRRMIQDDLLEGGTGSRSLLHF